MVTANRDTRRRFEQWAGNPECEANTISAVHGIRMEEVAKREQAPPSMGQSPFAIARGETFEKALFRNTAKRLREALLKSEVLRSDADFTDFRTRMHGGPYKTQEDARSATSEFFRHLGARREVAISAVIAAATICVPGGVMLPEALLVLDVLVVRISKRDGRPELVVGEVKTYPDRAGYTDGKELALTRAQAGVYVHGLRVVVEELGLKNQLAVSSEGFLILSRPGYNIPSVRPREDLTHQAERAARGFEMLRKAAAITPVPDADRPWEAIQRASTRYSENCLRFCDRVSVCRDQAFKSGAPAFLGDELERFLGETDLHRVVDLMGGANPVTTAEKDLVRRLEESELRPQA